MISIKYRNILRMRVMKSSNEIFITVHLPIIIFISFTVCLCPVRNDELQLVTDFERISIFICSCKYVDHYCDYHIKHDKQQETQIDKEQEPKNESLTCMIFTSIIILRMNISNTNIQHMDHSFAHAHTVAGDLVFRDGIKEHLVLANYIKSISRSKYPK